MAIEYLSATMLKPIPTYEEWLRTFTRPKITEASRCSEVPTSVTQNQTKNRDVG